MLNRYSTESRPGKEERSKRIYTPWTAAQGQIENRWRKSREK